MTRSTILTTASGRNVDLLNPTAADIDFADVAEHLAKEPRYNGATPRKVYSVAEHLCRGGDAIFEATQSPIVAGYFLLHDLPEYVLKDDTTPKKRAIEAIAVERFGILAGQITAAFDELTERWDRAAHEAAGLAWLPPPEIAAMVHRFDKIMLVTEWRDLMVIEPPFDCSDVGPLGGIIIMPWAWEVAEMNLLSRMKRWLPGFAHFADDDLDPPSMTMRRRER